MKMRAALLLSLAIVACNRASTDEHGVREPQLPPSSVPAAPQDTKAAAAAAALQDGIVVAALAPATNIQPQLIGYATVLDLSELFASASQYEAAQAQREQAAAHLQSTNAELQRQRVLNADNRNVSDRAVQETAATAASDAAAVRAAEASLRAAENAARQRWGAALASGVIRNAAWARGLARGDSALLEVAFSADGPPPATIQVQSRTARYLAQTPRVNARLLRASHYYLVAPGSQFPVGMTIDIHGNPASSNGVIVPATAVVWIDGAAAVFVEASPGKYEKHPIAATTHVPAGFLETSLAPGTRVVVQGAQQLVAAD
jgi:multidrug efflux system membrane fusion protein